MASLLTRQYWIAREYLQKYLEIATNPYAIVELGRLFQVRDQMDAALLAYERVISIRSSSPAMTFGLIEAGNVNLNLGNTPQAIANYRDAVEQSPQNIAAHFNLGMALIRSAQKAEALLHFEKAVAIFEQQQLGRLDPQQTANRLQSFGQAYWFLGKKERALELLSRAIEAAGTVQHGKIFSSIQYRWAPSEEFREETAGLIREIEGRDVPKFPDAKTGSASR